MDEASKIALFTGFGGVVLGGMITYFGEWKLRRQEAKATLRKNFVLCLCEMGRTVDELTSIYKMGVGILPDEAPLLISSSIRRFVSTSLVASSLETEKLFSVNHEEDELFSDMALYFRRFNSSLETLKAVNAMHIAVNARRLNVGLAVPTGHEDLASVTFDGGDGESIAELVTLENLYRDYFKFLIENITDGRNLIARLNKNSERKFHSIFNKKYPKLELSEEFNPLDYLSDLPRFSISDLPTQPA